MATNDQDEELECDALFRAMTRPAMIMGTTYEALIINLTVSSLCVPILKNGFYMLLVGIPIHLICVGICKFDERAFEILKLWFITKGSALASSYWGASTYSTLPIKRQRRS